MDSEDVIQTLQEHNYTAVSTLGKGGFSDCLLVYSGRYKMNFACKVITPSNIPGCRRKQSYQTEGQVLTHIMHPNIIKIYDMFTNEKRLFIILEYCENGDLMKHVLQNGPITNQKTFVRIVSMMLQALVYLESQKIAHCDIKPSNFLVDQVGRVKLADFGVTKVLSDDSRLSMDLTGSLPFLPPEILANKPYNPLKADVWSFGVTLYYLTCRELPFKAKNYNTLRQEISIGNIVFPNKMPAIARTLILRCLDVDPERRCTFYELKGILDSYGPSQLQKFPSSKLKAMKSTIFIPKFQRSTSFYRPSFPPTKTTSSPVL